MYGHDEAIPSALQPIAVKTTTIALFDGELLTIPFYKVSISINTIARAHIEIRSVLRQGGYGIHSRGPVT